MAFSYSAQLIGADVMKCYLLKNNYLSFKPLYNGGCTQKLVAHRTRSAHQTRCITA